MVSLTDPKSKRKASIEHAERLWAHAQTAPKPPTCDEVIADATDNEPRHIDQLFRVIHQKVTTGSEARDFMKHWFFEEVPTYYKLNNDDRIRCINWVRLVEICSDLTAITYDMRKARNYMCPALDIITKTYFVSWVNIRRCAAVQEAVCYYMQVLAFTEGDPVRSKTAKIRALKDMRHYIGKVLGLKAYYTDLLKLGDTIDEWLDITHFKDFVYHEISVINDLNKYMLHALNLVTYQDSHHRDIDAAKVLSYEEALQIQDRAFKPFEEMIESVIAHTEELGLKEAPKLPKLISFYEYWAKKYKDVEKPPYIVQKVPMVDNRQFDTEFLHFTLVFPETFTGLTKNRPQEPAKERGLGSRLYTHFFGRTPKPAPKPRPTPLIVEESNADKASSASSEASVVDDAPLTSEEENLDDFAPRVTFPPAPPAEIDPVAVYWYMRKYSVNNQVSLLDVAKSFSPEAIRSIQQERYQIRKARAEEEAKAKAAEGEAKAKAEAEAKAVEDVKNASIKAENSSAQSPQSAAVGKPTAPGQVQAPGQKMAEQPRDSASRTRGKPASGSPRAKDKESGPCPPHKDKPIASGVIEAGKTILSAITNTVSDLANRMAAVDADAQGPPEVATDPYTGLEYDPTLSPEEWEDKRALATAIRHQQTIDDMVAKGEMTYCNCVPGSRCLGNICDKDRTFTCIPPWPELPHPFSVVQYARPIDNERYSSVIAGLDGKQITVCIWGLVPAVFRPPTYLVALERMQKARVAAARMAHPNHPAWQLPKWQHPKWQWPPQRRQPISATTPPHLVAQPHLMAQTGPHVTHAPQASPHACAHLQPGMSPCHAAHSAAHAQAGGSTVAPHYRKSRRRHHRVKARSPADAYPVPPQAPAAYPVRSAVPVQAYLPPAGYPGPPQTQVPGMVQPAGTRSPAFARAQVARSPAYTDVQRAAAPQAEYISLPEFPQPQAVQMSVPQVTQTLVTPAPQVVRSPASPQGQVVQPPAVPQAQVVVQSAARPNVPAQMRAPVSQYAEFDSSQPATSEEEVNYDGVGTFDPEESHYRRMFANQMIADRMTLMQAMGRDAYVAAHPATHTVDGKEEYLGPYPTGTSLSYGNTVKLLQQTQAPANGQYVPLKGSDAAMFQAAMQQAEAIRQSLQQRSDAEIRRIEAHNRQTEAFINQQQTKFDLERGVYAQMGQR